MLGFKQEVTEVALVSRREVVFELQVSPHVVFIPGVEGTERAGIFPSSYSCGVAADNI